MRTEQEILKDFEDLGYKRNKNTAECMLRLEKENEKRVLRIDINRMFLGYCKYEITKRDCSEQVIYINMWEHKLITEYFESWFGGD